VPMALSRQKQERDEALVQHESMRQQDESTPLPGASQNRRRSDSRSS